MTRGNAGRSAAVIVGPLAPFADDYEIMLGVRGYCSRSICCELSHLARLSRWMEQRRIDVAHLGGERIDEFLGELPRRRGGGRVCSRRGLIQVLDVLNERGVERALAEKPASPSEALLASFDRFLLRERAAAPATAAAYVRCAGRFLDWCAPGGELAGLSANDVTGAVLRVSASASLSTTKLFVTALRSFLRFAFVEGLMPNELSAAALSVPRRHRSSLPMGVDRGTTDALLRSCDRRRCKGRRDYAILLILVRLGLRAGEVGSLCLQDFDWRAGEVAVHGKGGHEQRLPLPGDVGEAIVAYLRRGRPKGVAHREVFLRAVAPIGPLGTNAISGVVRCACVRAGVPIIRAHRLRHALACQMVKAGVALPEIAEVLRHRSISSSMDYARVDIDGLRTVAQPWPGGERR